MAEICGMQPEAMLFSKKILPIAEVTDKTFLDARAGRVVQADDRHAEFARRLNHIGDFFRVGAADAAGQHGAVLGINIDRPALDLAEAGDDAVGRLAFFRHAEIAARRFREHEFLDEGAGIEQFVDALAGGELAFGALPGRRFRVGVEGDLLALGKLLFEILLWNVP